MIEIDHSLRSAGSGASVGRVLGIAWIRMPGVTLHRDIILLVNFAFIIVPLRTRGILTNTHASTLRSRWLKLHAELVPGSTSVFDKFMAGLLLLPRYTLGDHTVSEKYELVETAAETIDPRLAGYARLASRLDSSEEQRPLNRLPCSPISYRRAEQCRD